MNSLRSISQVAADRSSLWLAHRACSVSYTWCPTRRLSTDVSAASSRYVVDQAVIVQSLLTRSSRLTWCRPRHTGYSMDPQDVDLETLIPAPASNWRIKSLVLCPPFKLRLYLFCLVAVHPPLYRNLLPLSSICHTLFDFIGTLNFPSIPAILSRNQIACLGIYFVQTLYSAILTSYDAIGNTVNKAWVLAEETVPHR